MKLPTNLKHIKIREEVGNPNEASIYIDGPIVQEKQDDYDVSPTGIRDALDSLKGIKTINFHINSPGGDVFSGIAIYNMLKQSKAQINVYIDALAASIASVIAMAGDTIFIPSNSMLMIHNPYTFVCGNANELRKAADDLDQITKVSVTTYLEKARNKLDESTLRELMDDETWLTAEAAVEYGLADQIVDANNAVASFDNQVIEKFKHIPKQLINKSEQKKKDPISKEEKLGLSDSTKQWLEDLKNTVKAEREARVLQLEQLRKEPING